MKPSRNIRINPRDSEYLDRTRGKPGEIFFDKESNTLKCYDGIVIGGFELAKADLSNIDQNALVDLTNNLNLVSTLDSYVNPPWIVSLAGSKITGRINNVVYIGDDAVVTNAMLQNRTVRFGTTTVNLGGNSNTIAGLTSVTATIFNGALSGNATTATRLRTPRKINGVDFDGTQDIVISADGEVIVAVDANSLTGTTLAPSVVSSSLTSVGTLTSLTVTGAISSSNNITATGNVTATGTASSNNLTVNNNASVNGNITANGNITSNSFVISSNTPVNKTHLTNKRYVDVRSVAMSVALS